MKEFWKDTTTLQLAGEEWRDIPGLPGYKASNLGRIKSLGRLVMRKSGSPLPIKEKILKQCVDSKDYLAVGMSSKPRRVHILVKLAFSNGRPAGKVIDHIDSNKHNNLLSNLRFVSQKENMNNPNSKMIKEVLQYTIDGKFIKKWDSITQAGEQLGIVISTIVSALKGKYVSAGGYQWRYYDNKTIPDKIPDARRHPVLQMSLDNHIIKEWDCASDAENELGLTRGRITRCCSGQRRYQTAGGFKWAYL